MGICEVLRDTILWIADKVKSEESPGRCRRCLQTCVTCPLACVTCCLEKVSREAIIWTAIWGDSFITSCCSSWKLVWENLDEVAAITVVSDFLMMLGKAFVCLLTTGGAGFLINYIYGNDVSSLVMPCTVIFIFTYVVSGLFMNMFTTTLNCIFFCFLVDETVNDPDQMYADPGLEQVVKKFEDSSKQRAEQMRKARVPPGSRQGGAAADGTPAGGDQKAPAAAAGTAAAASAGTAAATSSTPAPTASV